MTKISAACAAIVSLHPALKKGLLKQLMVSLRQGRSNRQKGAKQLLIWLISLLSRMFAFLSLTLKKK